MDVGTELRHAREAAGLSLEQIAHNTKIQVAKLEALEANDFELLPPGIYLEGIVRAYATEVGLDGNKFLASLNAPPAVIPTRHVDATAAYDLDTFASEARVDTHVIPATAAPPAALAEQVTKTRPVGGHRGGPGVAMMVLALAASFGLGWYLYRPSRPFPDAQRTAVPAVSGDAVRTGTPADASEATVPDSTASRDNEAAAPRASDTGAGEAQASATSTAAADADFSGIWRLNTEVESSSVKTYEGLQLGYHLQLDQDGTQISGNGQKISENGRALSGAARTAITVRGTVAGNQLALTFIEQGARRSTQGAFVLHRDDDGTLRGRFSSHAARSSGVVKAKRPRG